jgi:citrate lyase subunit beta/citryl-CoA lyase
MNSSWRTVALARSFLFVPGDRPERFAKAHSAGADAVVLDLEDSVDPAHTELARAAVRHALERSARPSMVRLSGPGEEDLDGDLPVLGPALSGVLVPKAEDPATIGRLITRLPEGVPVVLLVETARGVLAAASLAQMPRVTRLALGTVDLEADSGLSQDADVLRSVRVGMTLASRAAGIAGPVDGVCTDVMDRATTAAAAREAVRAGFTGKLCIHPRQVPPVNEVFRPAAEAVSWAQRVLTAAETQGTGAFRLDGEMVDAPVVARARAVIAAAVTVASEESTETEGAHR